MTPVCARRRSACTVVAMTGMSARPPMETSRLEQSKQEQACRKLVQSFLLCSLVCMTRVNLEVHERCGAMLQDQIHSFGHHIGPTPPTVVPQQPPRRMPPMMAMNARCQKWRLVLCVLCGQKEGKKAAMLSVTIVAHKWFHQKLLCDQLVVIFERSRADP